jgi:hypothetical protein
LDADCRLKSSDVNDDDDEWKNTNRPIAESPESFVNKDFQQRRDNFEKLLNDFVERLPRPVASASEKGRAVARKKMRKHLSTTAADAATSNRRETVKKAARRKVTRKSSSNLSAENQQLLKQLKDVMVILKELRSRQMRPERRRLVGLRRASKRGSKRVYDS